MSGNQKKTVSVSREAKILDKLADANGIGAEHVALRADLLMPFDITPDELDGTIIREAKRLHQEAMYKLYNRVASHNKQM